MGIMQIYAHKGYSARFPENTLAAFRAALELGMYGIELDIHCSVDDVPVVIHDERLERTTNGTGLVADQTASTLARLDAGSGEYVPTLEEVLALAGGRVHFDLEIKAANCESAVLQVLRRHPEAPATISSFNWDVLAKVRELAPEFELWVLTQSVTDQALDAARKLGATTLAIHFESVDRTAMDRAAAAELDVMAWTVNTQTDADRLRDLGVTALCTDDPAVVH